MRLPSPDNCYGFHPEDTCPLLTWREGPKGRWACQKNQIPNTSGCFDALTKFINSLPEPNCEMPK